MTCRKARKAIPLLARGDIGRRRAEKVLAHIAFCESCRRELEAYRSSIERARSAGSVGEIKGWSEAEWHALMARITAGEAPRKTAAFGLPPQWAIISGVAAGVLLIGLAVLFKDAVFKGRGQGAGPGQTPIMAKTPATKANPAQGVAPALAAQKPAAASPGQTSEASRERTTGGPGSEKAAGSGTEKVVKPRAASALSQDVVSVTLVSQETGLQVVWFFDKNFEWKGDKK